VNNETLVCSTCGKSFEREKARGRKPKNCPVCVRYGNSNSLFTRPKPSAAVELPSLNDHWEDLGFRVPKYFSDDQMASLEQNAEWANFLQSGSQCVVCRGNGSYRYNGQEFECPDDAYGHVIMRLVKWYWLHNIKLQHQQLSWAEWPMENECQVEAKAAVEDYISLYHSGYSISGVGLTFYAKGLGTGKTWAATTILKELVKQGTDGWFAPFYEVKGYFGIDDAKRKSFLIKKAQTTPLLVLDEIQVGGTQAQKNLYSDQLEELIRPRTDSNFATIITTNMTPGVMEKEYPRIYSLFAAKNMLVELTGEDARLGSIVLRRNVEATANGESLPVS